MEDKEILTFSYRAGYYNADDILDVPAGAMIYPSSNIIYNRKGRPMSIRDYSNVYSGGGSRAVALDSDLVGFMGRDDAAQKAIGNIFKGGENNLWFVGNAVADAVQVVSGLSTQKQIGGIRQVETLTVVGTVTGAGNLTITTTGANITAGVYTVAVALNDTPTIVARKIATVLRGSVPNSTLSTQYYIKHEGAVITLTDKTIRANDATLNMALALTTATGVTPVASSTNTTSGQVYYYADLSTTPQIAKYNGSFWENPVQVGLAPETTSPVLTLTADATRGALFTGIITGSTSCRAARKRNGSVSIASGASNIVTGDADSVYVTIPPYADDYSELEDRSWILYFTYFGRGSQYAHLQFPIEIPESVLDGSADLGWSSTQGNARIQVISQSDSVQADRIVEVEFYNNDLLLLEPYDDYYGADPCKFMVQLGNVNCLIGTGENSTGFDVSYPNFREAYSPDWREWFSEVPVSIAHSTELGMFWVLTANTTYQAIWTGATQETAPVVLRQVTSKIGCIGEGACVAANGVLYFLSKGLMPVRISADRQVDVNFGSVVKNAFSTFTSATQVGYDEYNNSIVFTCGMVSLAYQIDTGLWGSLTSLAAGNGDYVDALFSMNGYLYACVYTTGGLFGDLYETFKYDAASTAVNWQAVSSFQTGKYGLNLKDIIELRMVVQGDVASYPQTITYSAFKDFNVSTNYALSTFSIASAGVKISYRKLLESIDYEAISIKTSGTLGGQTVHESIVTIDHHSIERGV